MKPAQTWPPERSDRLIMLWRLGWTAGRIARDLGVSRNAVIGKAHRLGLAGRPSPIRHKEAA